MSFNSLPEFVRIKRKRNQDSLQALILELPKNKRVKNEQFVFKLQRTDSQIESNDSSNTLPLPLLQESGAEKDKENTYIIPKLEKRDEKLPEQFTEMLDSILNLGQDQNHDDERKLKRKLPKSHGRGLSSINKGTELELEYVYDVYYRDKAVQETWEVNRFGYIKFEEDANDLVNDDENDSLLAVSDDEDSNAEDFYQNDYPEDEDAGNDNDGLENEEESEEQNEEGENNETFDELYEKHFANATNEIPKDFLQSLQQEFEEDDEQDEDEDEDIEENGDDNDYKRQNFFPDEEDDELAKHRDRIFGKLEKMIERASK